MNCETATKFPLSYQQELIWQRQRNAISRRATCWVGLYGPLDPVRLHDCIRNAVRQHEILRTVFCREAESRPPSPQVRESDAFVWIQKDLTQQTESFDAARLQQWLDDQVDSGDPKQEPALRALLATITAESHALLLSLPALCADRPSMEHLVEIIGLLYSNERQDPEDIFQYADFALWQQEVLTEDDSEAGREFWRQWCHNLQPRNWERAWPAIVGEDGSDAPIQRWTVEVDASLVARIESSSLPNNTSWPDLLLACWHAFLSRITQVQDQPMGLECGGRNIPEFKHAIGPFAKWLPYQVTVAPEATFASLLASVQQAVAEVKGWQQSFSGLSEAGAQTVSMPEVAFDYAELWDERQYGGAQFKLLRVESGREGFALRLSARRQGAQLGLDFYFDASRLDRQTIQEWSESYLILLSSALGEPHRSIGQLPLLSQRQRHRLLVEWNQTAAEYPRTRCMQELIEQQAARTPERTAVRCMDRQLSYQELNEQANQVAHWLRAHGVGPDQRVGLCVDRSLEMVVGLLGILKAGGAYVPLNAEHPPLRLAQQLQGAVALVTEAGSLAQFPEFKGTVICLDRDGAEWRACPRTNPDLQTTPDNLVYVLFTSGSTGVPKGVAVRHRNLVNYTWFARVLLELEKFPQGLQFALVSTVCADVGITCIYPALTSGGCLHVLPYEVATDSARYGEYASRERIDVLKIVPSHLAALLAAGGGKAVLPRKHLVVGGEKLTRELVERITAEGMGCEIVNHYAPSETTCGSLTLRLSGFPWKNWRGGSMPLGRPISNTRLYVLDSAGEPVPAGVKGELYIAGDGVSAGYTEDAQRTKERFLPDRFVEGARMYRSGDLVRYLADGNIEFLERMDDQVKIRGYRVELGEVQAVLEALGGVKQAVVLAREQERGERRLLAWVVGREGKEICGAELREQVKLRLPEYMVPARIMVLAKFPLTRNGKIDRQTLPEPEAVVEYVAPRTPMEEAVEAIWREVLERERISVEENFFDIGGHSLIATRIAARLRRHFDLTVPVRMLFEHPTIAGLAGQLEHSQQEELGLAPQSIRPVPRSQPLPLSFAQERLWVLDQFEPPSALYNIPRAWRLKGALQVAALHRALNEIIRRHESQRTTFQVSEGRPVQIIAESLHIPLPIHDLTSLPPVEREDAARRFTADEALRPFNLEQGPLVRAHLVRLSFEDHVLLVVSHHIISDAWSAGVFFRELRTLYQAFCQATSSPLPEPAIQYADYAAHEREWLQGEVLERHAAYWRKELAGAPLLLELPTDHPRSTTRSFRGACERVPLSSAVSRAIQQLCRSELKPQFTALMSGFQALLWRYSGQSQIVVGTDVANRNAPELEHTLGFFINVLPIRADFSENPTFRGLLSRVQQCLFGAYAHQQFPFAKMVQEIQSERSRSHNPLVQALFVFQNVPPPERALSGLKVEPFPLPVTSSKFDLAVFMAEEQDTLVGHWVYSTDLFERRTILEMSRRFERLLEKAALSPDTPLDSLNFLSAEGKQRGEVELVERKQDQAKWIFASSQVLPEPEAVAGYVAPRTPMEEAVEAIWCEVLDRDRISVEENFFDIGGHSLIATQIAARLRSRFGLAIYVRMLFDHPTIRELAQSIEEGWDDLVDSSGLEIVPAIQRTDPNHR